MAKLTDRQRKQIIAEYVAGGSSYRKLAEKYGVSATAIKKILSTDESVQKLTDKKDENVKSMLDFLESRREQAQSLLDKILNLSDADIKSAPLRDKMGAFKILSEAFGGKPVDKQEIDSTVKVVMDKKTEEYSG